MRQKSSPCQKSSHPRFLAELMISADHYEQALVWGSAIRGVRKSSKSGSKSLRQTPAMVDFGFKMSSFSGHPPDRYSPCIAALKRLAARPSDRAARKGGWLERINIYRLFFFLAAPSGPYVKPVFQRASH